MDGKKTIEPFNQPIFITRPILPDLDKVNIQLRQIWDSKWLTNDGQKLGQLEKDLKKFLGIKNISLICNGTQALQLGIKALDLKGEVITTPFTFPATCHSLILNNIKPVFADIEEEYFTLDPKKIEPLITSETSAVLPVHVFGNPAKIYQIEEIAKKYNLKVIYDAAHAFGVEFENKGIGGFGDASIFSFHATKIFHTLEGGALTTNNPDLIKKMNYLRNFGIKNEEEIVSVGTNAKMNEIQAAIGILVLKEVREEIEKRKKIFDIYKDYLKKTTGIKLFEPADNVKSNYIYFPITINKENFSLSRDELHQKLKEFNVFTRKYFYPLCNNYDCYNPTDYRTGDLKIAEKAAQEILCLPIYGELKKEEVIKICDIINLLGKQS